MIIKEYGRNGIDTQQESANVWFCESCGSYHIRAGNTVLTFSKEEFLGFIDETWNCYCEKETNVLALQ